jgi:hypothetical protein
MFEHDMLPYGVNSAAEALSGVAPNASTETCDVADFIHSNTWLLRNTGKAAYGDRLERAFHNAAPGAVNRDYTKHVYYQNANLQHIPVDYIEYSNNISRRWSLNEMHTPPCCTGNQARLLPNYIHHSWTATKDGGLAATMYGPNFVSAPTKGGLVNITSATTYPFSDTVTMHVVTTAAASGTGGAAPVTFPLHLRLPGWCDAPKIKVNGIAITIAPNKLGFHVETRAWNTGDTVVITLPMKARIETAATINVGGVGNGYNKNRNNWVEGGLPYSTVSLGPLLFALPLESPDSEWRYALVRNQTLTVHRGDMPTHWDWPLAAPLTIRAKVQRISNFEDVWELPKHPEVITGGEGAAPVEVELVPYGCSKVFKVSMLPFV